MHVYYVCMCVYVWYNVILLLCCFRMILIYLLQWINIPFLPDTIDQNHLVICQSLDDQHNPVI